jgi:hypothetical protein
MVLSDVSADSPDYAANLGDAAHRRPVMIRNPLRRIVVLATSAVAVAVTALALGAPAGATTAQSCAVTWGSLVEHGPVNGPVSGAALSNVRTGRQACYDRLVIDIRGTSAMKSYRAGYVRQVTQDPSGRPVSLRGGAFLQIAVGASDHTASGVLTYAPANRRELADVSSFSAFRQVAWAGSSEGITSVGLGVRARLPFRVTTLTGIPGSSTGTRVVIDVAHSW